MSACVYNICVHGERGWLRLMNKLKEAKLLLITQGLLTEDKVKDCASRLFMVRMKLGEFDPPEMNPYKQYFLLLNINTCVNANMHYDVLCTLTD